MFNITLKDLRQNGACFSGYNEVVRSLGGKAPSDERYARFAHKEPISIEAILESNGLDDALWALRCVKGRDRDLRLYAVWCARQVEHLMADQRSKDALDVAERHANGEASDEELVAARDAARAAAWDAARAAAGAALRPTAERLQASAVALIERMIEDGGQP